MIKRRKQSSNRTLVLKALNNSYNKKVLDTVDMERLEELVMRLIYSIKSLQTYPEPGIHGLGSFENALTSFFEHWTWNADLIPPTRTIVTEGLCGDIKKRLINELMDIKSMTTVLMADMSEEDEHWIAYQLFSTTLQLFLTANPIIGEAMTQIGGSSGHGSE